MSEVALFVIFECRFIVIVVMFKKTLTGRASFTHIIPVKFPMYS